MPNNPIRRAQMISTFGPGAMMVTKDGVSVIAAGIDHWYKKDTEGSEKVDTDQFVIREWRLERELDVQELRMPPDYRFRTQDEDESVNMYLKVPFLRFPKFHHCRKCNALSDRPLTANGRQNCLSCENDGHEIKLVQVRFIAMCKDGHIQDFPWREWVHHSASPSCNEQLRMRSTGGAGLGGIIVSCDCGTPSRTLEGITTANPDGTTVLSDRLDEKSKPFLCRGHRPWLGTDEPEGCIHPLQGTLRSAANVHFAQVKSALFIPSDQNSDTAKLLEKLKRPPFSDLVQLLLDGNKNCEQFVRMLRGQYRRELDEFSDADLSTAYLQITSDSAVEEAVELEGEVLLRYEEYQVLSNQLKHNDLVIREADLSDYSPDIQEYFSKIMLVEKLKETRAYYGFRRINAEGLQDIHQLKAMLRRNPNAENANWLPAYNVFGEGLFFLLNEEKLRGWEQDEEVVKRIQALRKRSMANAPLSGEKVTPRFVMMHTLAHLLINQLTFSCGYSSSALRERLYVSDHPETGMSGILIYTAAGDSDGTMGGLVRMGKKEFLEPVLYKALKNAEWCSSDPVCMEVGGQGGQGPYSLNLAACHSCGLVPETACEEFNRYLDRALVVGTANEPDMGFFKLRR